MRGPQRGGGSRPSGRATAFTLTELLMVVALIGILSGIVIVNSTFQWRRERVNALANELAGWLEEVMAYSMRNNAQCDIQISTGTLAVGATVASITNTSVCPVREPKFTIPGVLASGTYQYDVASFNADSGTTQTTITYTPRGAITATNNLQILMAVRPGGETAEPPLRCVQVSGTLGLIGIGRNDSASETTAANICSTFNVI